MFNDEEANDRDNAKAEGEQDMDMNWWRFRQPAKIYEETKIIFKML